MEPNSSWAFKSIPIDFDVFKALTAELTSPTDTYNDVLRRKYDLGARPPANENLSAPTGAYDRSWICDGVEFPNGTLFRVHYKRQRHSAIVEDGALAYQGQRYSTPSAAAIAVTGGNVNGWRFWECRLPGENGWIKIDRLRHRRSA